MNTNNNFGAVVLNLPQTKGNPRNSEGAFITLPDGDILFVYSRYQGDDCADHAVADLWVARSTDGGESFDEGRVLLRCEDEQAVNIMSPTLLWMQNGDVGIFYLVRTTYSLMRMFLRRSSDNCQTFGERIICTPQEGFFVVNNDRVTRLQSGRIIIPTAIHRKGYLVKAGEDGDGYFDSRSESMFFLSDDDGVTWRPSHTKCCSPFTAHSTSGLQEPGVIELSPDLLWGWARTDLGRQYEMLSMDGGDTWTAPQPSRFTAPLSPLCMKRAANGYIYAIWNPIPFHTDQSGRVGDVWTGGRTPLAIAYSKDNGKTFCKLVAFETDPGSGYCYTAIHFTDKCLLLSYCAGGAGNKMCLCHTRIRRIELNDLDWDSEI